MNRSCDTDRPRRIGALCIAIQGRWNNDDDDDDDDDGILW